MTFPTPPVAKAVDDRHANSDVDSSNNAQHHTIGVSPNQVNSGVHNHDGANSKRLPASSIKEIDDDWIPYTPIWTNSSGVAPSPGAGTLTGRYMWFPNSLGVGGLLFYDIDLLLGAGFVVGTGLWQFTLPFTADAVFPHAPVGILDSGGARWPVAGRTNTTLIFRTVPSGAAAGFQGLLGPNNPGGVAYASGDFLRINGFYRPA